MRAKNNFCVIFVLFHLGSNAQGCFDEIENGFYISNIFNKVNHNEINYPIDLFLGIFIVVDFDGTPLQVDVSSFNGTSITTPIDTIVQTEIEVDIEQYILKNWKFRQQVVQIPDSLRGTKDEHAIVKFHKMTSRRIFFYGLHLTNFPSAEIVYNDCVKSIVVGN